MTTVVARIAIVFAGIIVAGVLLNVYILVATFTVGAVLSGMGFTREQEFAMLYWPCLIAGFVSAFFLMRPVWKATGKKPARKEIADAPKTDPEQISN